ncbi:hypothetical protein Vadar_025994 [Vaccinium darrowii]|uniref:Uncharacterized protein n=1 Tax=Vaccinium darrowii TaxID=229202 RepID=A0ACB7X406_9ERIC|nr:hypothetical protein Vadar_025994 [Vaccinium darrowii]
MAEVEINKDVQKRKRLVKEDEKQNPLPRSQTNPNPSNREAMDDTCAVCAEMLEWTAYAKCGHREVCSTCIARLRFICADRRCCICKSESNIVFFTKALGDYTKTINDFSIFPVDPTEGQVGSYWYHEGTQAFFDDFDHYKMIAAMCKLSCIVCDKKDEQGSEESMITNRFGNIEQLRSHLFLHHRLFTCSLCLEGRKIFIHEQKLYTRAQLNRHINSGDSVVDGSEAERGGFKGHPMCEFCQNPFYGDSELYTHMSTEHYTCHICQRQRPEQYDYYRNYDDLEIHFRREHFLCEDEACLAKKFIVFPNESEMKRHNAMEHGGHMSRSQRNVTLQIPISFQYRRSREQDQTRRRHGFHPDYSESELSSAIQASFETADAYVPRVTSSRAHTDSDHRETSEIDPIRGSFGSLAFVGSGHSTRNASLDSGPSTSNAALEESFFPPLPGSAKSSHQKTKKVSKGLGRTTMASHLRQQNNVNVLNASQLRPTDSRLLSSQIGSSSQLRPTSYSGHVSSSVSSSSSTMTKSTKKVTHSASISKLVDRDYLDPAISASPVPTTQCNNQPLAKVEDVKNANKSLVESIRAALGCDEDKYAAFKVLSSEYRQGIIDTPEYLAYVHQFGLSHHVLGLARLCPDAQKQKELVEACSGSLRSDVPLKNNPLDNSSQLKHKKSSKKGKEKCNDNAIGESNGTSKDNMNDNKSLVERIRSDLDCDEDKYAAFKVISSEYRQGIIDTREYLAYVHQFGLSHRVLELARLCPDAQKQKELIEACSGSLRSNGPLENNTSQLKHKKSSKKGKEKCNDNAIGDSNGTFVDSIAKSTRELQLNHKLSGSNGLTNLISSNQTLLGMSVQAPSQPTAHGSKKSQGTKPRKKTSKFHRVRLGESSSAAVLDLVNSDGCPDPTEGQSDDNTRGDSKALPVRGVWENGGGRRLVGKLAMTR